MIKINNYATKNHLNEWEIKDLPESEVYRLDLANSLDLLFLSLDKISEKHSLNYNFVPKFFIPYVPNKKIYFKILETMMGDGIWDCVLLHFFDEENEEFANITPDWSKYIPEDHAVLFLSEEDREKYQRYYSNYNIGVYQNDSKTEITFDVSEVILNDKNEVIKNFLDVGFKTTSIIAPSIHSQNIQEINNIAKQLKEKYGVERVEVIATHCHLPLWCGLGEANFNDNCDYGKCYADKFIVTDSTRKVTSKIVNNCAKNNHQEHYVEKIEVVDCEEFFNQVSL